MAGDRAYPRAQTTELSRVAWLPLLMLTISEFQTNQALAGLLYFACPRQPALQLIIMERVQFCLLGWFSSHK